ncbi:MAG: hypothetical protein QOK40_3691 [Miltoncostaeaceae bacterium]|jgi:hypothetical protein|nr:hypothetical protein [Miltoncostaeaceae bacterium]
MVTSGIGAGGPHADPPVAAWERDTGLRWGERIAMTILLDRRSGVRPECTAAALAPRLRQMTAGQVGLAARALERMAAAERTRGAIPPAGLPGRRLRP